MHKRWVSFSTCVFMDGKSPGTPSVATKMAGGRSEMWGGKVAARVETGRNLLAEEMEGGRSEFDVY